MLAEIDERYAWLQQDGATCHMLRDSMKVLTEFFDDRVISKELCGHLVYRTCQFRIFSLDISEKRYLQAYNPYTLDELKSNIFPAISDINSYTLRKVTINLVKRVRFCVQKTDTI
ncbi:uncharacterized protein TNCV_149631 [Trichonephila clavipes]|nr:uncharacterized protein TNCV_149631 [Trichonephila clavipes]